MAYNSSTSARRFYGWRVIATSILTFGIAVGVPYYNIPFFYDYFQKSFHWSLSEITLGFPIAAVLTLWVGPLIIPRFSARKLIVVGSGLTALAFLGFAEMNGALLFYFVLYFVYTVGYLLSGPIPHQILVSYWYQKKRGRAMGIVYVGVGLCGGLGAFFVRGITGHFGFRTALLAVGALMFVVWPLAVLILKDRPSEIGQFPDGESQPPPDLELRPEPISRLLRNWPFWLLLIGSFCSIGSIGSINMHMKFVFRDQGFTNQKLLNAAWTDASVLILWSSIAGRLGIGYLADRFSKKWVMTATYFIVAASILLLFSVSPERHSSLYVFAVVFGFAMGADYMLIPLIAADQFGVNTLSRAMAIILPVNAIGGSWCPELVSVLRQQYGSYGIPLTVVFGIAVAGAIAIAIMPKGGVTFDTGAERAVIEASRNA